ncbi:uncharacterized protein LOC114541068 [Dendronephthya gigantea]|uniref:uncharacterized protein LOC114541068 n=1 Tax=Dendronephthya gigantea TaxID=151771 RepID=UPI00106A8CA1|nr:uncharacterized protein LOC114541068 [Dendronephthya gigantea]
MDAEIQSLTTWKCFICTAFVALTFRALMGHYYTVHSNSPNFFVRCHVNGCPATYRRYHSFYKHVVRNHSQEYDALNEATVCQSLNGSLCQSISRTEPVHSNSDDENFNMNDNEGVSSDTGSTDSLLDYSEDSENENECGNPLAENLDFRQNEALFVLKVKERNRITQVALDNIIESTSTIMNSALELVKKNIIQAWESHEPGHDFAQTITDLFGKIPSPFSSLGTNYLQASYIKKHLNYVDTKEIVLGKKISRKNSKNKRLLIEKEETFQYIPLIESLCQLLSNKKIAKVVIRKPNQCAEDIFYDICDGKVFKSDHFFTEHPDALQIIIYHDAVEVCNKNSFLTLTLSPNNTT